MKTIFHIALLAAAVTLLAGCATPKPPLVAADPAILRVGVTPNAPPMIFKRGGQIVGVEADLAQALGRELGRKVVFVELKWEDLIDALGEDKADILMSSLTITPARRYRVAFTDPYIKVGQMALVRSEDQYSLLANLAGFAKDGIGVVSGTTAEQFLRFEFPRAKVVKRYNSGEDAAVALAGRSVDMLVSDAPLIWYLAGLYESKGLTVAPTVLTEEYLGWGVRRTDEKLRNAANAFLKRAKDDGEFNRTLNAWMPGFR
jgi:polar amino acid transport system substrate-binding protein